MPILLTILERDAPEDPEMGKIVLETLNVLCETEEGKPVSRKLFIIRGNANRQSERDSTTHETRVQACATPTAF